MSESIADLNIALRATADKLAADINRGVKGAQSATSVQAVALGTAIGLSVVAGLGAAMAGVKKVIGLAFEGLDRIDALDEAASKIGITYNALQDLKLAAVTTGASFEGMVTALTKMQGNLSNGSATEALQKLGLSAEYLRQLAPERQFAEIAQKLSEIKNTGDKIDLTKSIFGRGGVDIMNVINGGKEGMAEIARTAELFGGHLTDAQRAMATMAQGDIETLGAGWGYIKDQIAVGVAPALLSTLETIVKIAEESGGVAKIFRDWSDSLMEFSADVADAFQTIQNGFRVLGSVKDDANIWSVSPILAFAKASKAAEAEVQKILITQESAGNVIRRKYEERKVAAERAAIAERQAAEEKKRLDDEVANNFSDTTEEMAKAYAAQIEANKAKNNEFSQSFDSIWKVMPEKVGASLDEIVEKYTTTTKGLKELTVEWVSMMIQNFLAVSNLMSNVQYVSAGDWWKKTNEMLQSLNSGKKLGAEDGQATLDSMRSNQVELSPSEKAMANSSASRKVSQDRYDARVAANRAESRAKSDARKAGIGGSMKIGSFDGTFTAPASGSQAPSFFPGGNKRLPVMKASGTEAISGTTINQYFSSGVTRAELAGSMDDLKDATLGAVVDAFSNGGGFRKALQA